MKQQASFLVLLIALNLAASTSVSGILDRDTRWKVEESPYIVTSDLVIPPGISLSVSPGVTIIINYPDTSGSSIGQIDKTDSSLTSIKVFGILSCAGKFEQRIRFTSNAHDKMSPRWYGIVMSKADDRFSEIAFTDIENAFTAITVHECKPIIRNMLIERNHIGIYSSDLSAPHIYNCIITHNNAYGIRINNGNPIITNNIICYNANNGIWCDGMSQVKISYNCIYGNNDGNFLECDPEIGTPQKKHDEKLPVDAFHNIISDPVFAGSAAELDAIEKDISLPTKEHFIKNKLIASVLNPPKESIDQNIDVPPKKRFTLSRYSPCINAGDPAKKFLDKDGTRNDIGFGGGPEFIENKTASPAHATTGGAPAKHKASGSKHKGAAKKKKGH